MQTRATHLLLPFSIVVFLFAWAWSAALVRAQSAAISPDQRVLSKIHQTNQLEIELGNLAEQKATRPKVRAYGDRLARDHSFADGKIRALAQREGIQLVRPQPQTAEEKQFQEKQTQLVEKLKRLRGPKFDQAYLDAMVQGHAHAIETLQGATKKLNDTDVRSWVEKLIPILRQHLQLAEQLERTSTIRLGFALKGAATMQIKAKVLPRSSKQEVDYGSG